MAYIFVGVLLLEVVVFWWLWKRKKQRDEQRRNAELDLVKKSAEEDVIVFGEEVADLDVVTAGVELSEAGRQDYSRALEAYESAKKILDNVKRPEDIRHVTESLEDGRYAASCVKARVEGKELPVRRPPCFFNPQHGPSVEDIDWAPVGGQPRPVPVCAADAERVAVGAEPAVRKVPDGSGIGRKAYWEAGSAYAQYNRGYFNSYTNSGLLPGVLMGAMLFGGWGTGWDGSYAEGFQDGMGADSTDSGGMDSAGDMSGMNDIGGISDGGGFDFF